MASKSSTSTTSSSLKRPTKSMSTHSPRKRPPLLGTVSRTTTRPLPTPASPSRIMTTTLRSIPPKRRRRRWFFLAAISVSVVICGSLIRTFLRLGTLTLTTLPVAMKVRMEGSEVKNVDGGHLNGSVHEEVLWDESDYRGTNGHENGDGNGNNNDDSNDNDNDEKERLDTPSEQFVFRAMQARAKSSQEWCQTNGMETGNANHKQNANQTRIPKTKHSKNVHSDRMRLLPPFGLSKHLSPFVRFNEDATTTENAIPIPDQCHLPPFTNDDDDDDGYSVVITFDLFSSSIDPFAPPPSPSNPTHPYHERQSPIRILFMNLLSLLSHNHFRGDILVVYHHYPPTNQTSHDAKRQLEGDASYGSRIVSWHDDPLHPVTLFFYPDPPDYTQQNHPPLWFKYHPSVLHHASHDMLLFLDGTRPIHPYPFRHSVSQPSSRGLGGEYSMEAGYRLAHTNPRVLVSCEEEAVEQDAFLRGLVEYRKRLVESENGTGALRRLWEGEVRWIEEEIHLRRREMGLLWHDYNFVSMDLDLDLDLDSNHVAFMEDGTVHEKENGKTYLRAGGDAIHPHHNVPIAPDTTASTTATATTRRTIHFIPQCTKPSYSYATFSNGKDKIVPTESPIPINDNRNDESNNIGHDSRRSISRIPIVSTNGMFLHKRYACFLWHPAFIPLREFVQLTAHDLVFVGGCSDDNDNDKDEDNDNDKDKDGNNYEDNDEDNDNENDNDNNNNNDNNNDNDKGYCSSQRGRMVAALESAAVSLLVHHLSGGMPVLYPFMVQTWPDGDAAAGTGTGIGGEAGDMGARRILIESTGATKLMSATTMVKDEMDENENHFISTPHHHLWIGDDGHRRRRRSWDIPAPPDSMRMKRDINVGNGHGGDNRYPQRDRRVLTEEEVGTDSGSWSDGMDGATTAATAAAGGILLDAIDTIVEYFGSSPPGSVGWCPGTPFFVKTNKREEDGIYGNQEKEKSNTSTSGMGGEQGADEYECILGDTLLSREMLPWMHDDG